MTIAKDIGTEELKLGLAEGSILLIDVREPHEFVAGHIPGALLLPLSQLDAQDIPANGGQRVVFACAAGVRSLKALQIAQEGGVAVDTHYAPGFKGWAAAGEAIERD